LLLHLNEVVIFLTNFITQAFATAGLHGRAVIAVLTAQLDHRLCVGVPLILQCLKPLEAVNLLRVIADQFLQAFQLHIDLRLGDRIRVEEMLISGDQKAAHAGFQVNRQPHRFVGIADDPITVLNPADYRQQIADHNHKQRGTERADGQRQTDVATQELAKASLVD